MADEVKKSANEVSYYTKAVLEATDSIRGWTEEYIAHNKSQKENIASLLKFNQTVGKTSEIYKGIRRDKKELLNNLINETNKLKKIREEEEKLQKIINKRTMTTKESFNAVKESTKALSGQMMGLATTLGGVGVSFSSIVQSGMAYEKSLYRISRIQQVAGKDSVSFSSALTYVKKNTLLAKNEFAELVSVVQDGFLGLKPSMMETAKLSEMIAAKVGPTFEAQKDAAQRLIQIQSQFPSIGQEIIDIMKEQQNLASKGGGSAAERESLKMKQQTLQIMMQQSGMNKESEFMLQLTSEQTAEQAKLNEALTEQQKMNKELKDVQLKMYEELKPLMMFAMKSVTKIAELTSDWSGTIGLAVKGLVGLRAAQATFNLVANANPYVRIGMAILAAGTYVTSLIDKQNKSKKIAKEQVNMAKLEEDVAQNMNGLSKERSKNLKEQWEKIKASGASVEDMKVEVMNVIKAEKEQNNEITKQRINLNAIVEDTEKRLQLIDKITTAFKTQNSMSEEFGLINDRALKGMIKMAETSMEKLTPSLREAVSITQKEFAEKGISIPINVSGDIGSQMEQVQEFLMRQREIVKTQKEREDIDTRLLGLADLLKKYEERKADITRANTSNVEREIRQQESMTSAYESRLDAERRLMESAQFGLGASVDMMQKQVDLAYELQGAYEKADKEYQGLLRTQTRASEYDIKRLQSAKTQAEAEDYIKNTMKATGKEQQLLSQYAQKHQVWTQKIMDQQQKIYDLTKDVREGYLDAIREMAVGAGEFEKIIGTQETGVTQLMKAVKDVTGEAKLNTMALGGTQGQQQTSQGVGTDISGQYTIGGIQFNRGGEDQRNRRIYKYQSYKEQAEAAMRGNNGTRSKVGSATVSGVQEYLGPERNEEITPEQEAQRQAPILAKAIGEETADALLKYTERSVKVGGSYAAGRFDVGGAAAIRANGVSSGSMGAALLNSSSGSRASFGGARPSSSGQVLAGGEKNRDKQAETKTKAEKLLEESRRHGKALDSLREASDDILRTSVMTARGTAPNRTGKFAGKYGSEYWVGGVKYSGAMLKEDVKKRSAELQGKKQERFRQEQEYIDELRGKEIEAHNKRVKEIESGKESTNLTGGIAAGSSSKKASETREMPKSEAELIIERSKKEEADLEKKRKKSDAELAKSIAIARGTGTRTGMYADKQKDGTYKKTEWVGGVKYSPEYWSSEKISDISRKTVVPSAIASYGTGAAGGAAEELASRTNFLRSQIGTVKPKKGQTQEDADFRAATKYFDDQHIEKFAKEDFERAMKDKQELRVKGTGAGSGKTAKFGSATVDKVRSSGYTSAAQERGMEATALAQSNYEAAASSRESIYGATGDESSGGGPVITIRLADGLRADVEGAGNLRLEILQGSKA